MSFAKYSIQTILVRSCIVIVGLAIGIINARWLGPEGVGIIALLLLVKSFAFRFGNLGFGSAFAFFVARKEVSARWALNIIWGVGSIMSVLSIIIILVIWQCDFSPWNDIRPSLFYLCLPTIPLIFFNNYMQRILSGKLRITAMNIAELFKNIGNVAFLIILVIIFKKGVAGSVISVLLSDVMAFVYLILQTRKRVDEENAPNEPAGSKGGFVYSLWRYGRWNYLLMFTNFLIEELPVVLLKNFSLANSPIGFFSKARGFGRYSRNITLPISQVLFPYTAASKGKEATVRTNILCRNFLVIMGLIVPIMILCARPLFLILYGEAFLPAVGIFYVLVMAVIVWPVGHFLAIHVAASGNPRMVFLANLGTLMLAVLSYLYFIPRYGPVGCALSVSIICVTQTLLRLIVYVRVTGALFSEVLLPRRTDWAYYQRLLKQLSLKFSKNV